MKDPIRKFIREQIKSLAEAKVDYDFSEKELVRVLKQLKRGASTEIDMINAFSKALGRQITDKELFGETTAEAVINEFDKFESIDFDVKSINMVYTDSGRFYGFNIYSEPGLKGKRVKLSYTEEINKFLQSKGIQTEIPEGYDMDVLDSIVADLKKQGIEAEHHDYMDVSEGYTSEWDPETAAKNLRIAKGIEPKYTTYTKGEKVTYLGYPAVITGVKEYNDRIYYSVSYDKGNGKTKASSILSTDGTIKPLKEEKSKEDQLKIARAAFKKAEMDGDIRGSELALAAIDLIKGKRIKGVGPASDEFRKKVKDYLAKKKAKNLKEMTSELGYMNEESTETGLMVIPRTRQDANKIYAYLDDSNWTADWNSAEGYFLFPEEEDMYDSLEAEIEEFLVDIGADARIEGIF